VPVKETQLAIEVALREEFDLVGGDILEQFLSHHRLRFTGGVHGEAAVAARDELGADAILVTSIVTYRSGSPPAIGITMRLVSAAEEPVILWMDQASFDGDEAPGLLGLGRVESMPAAQDRVLTRLVRSLRRALEGEAASPGDCGGGWRYAPKVRFRSRVLDEPGRVTLAVMPFLNRSARRGAGEIVSLEFVRQLVATGQYRVLEPGVVREYLLRARVIMPGGVSLEATRLLLGAMDVDLVLSGVVQDYGESAGTKGVVLRFTATVVEGHGGRVVWQSRSYNHGDEGVYFFGLGRVLTQGKLACRMVEPVVRRIVGKGRRAPAASAATARATSREPAAGGPARGE
jgi:hypothetical protein